MDAASGGTLFLDEEGEIPLVMQIKLLRLLETSTYRRVGDTELHPCPALEDNLEQLAQNHKGSRLELAKKLGISERTLYRRLKSLEDGASN